MTAETAAPEPSLGRLLWRFVSLFGLALLGALFSSGGMISILVRIFHVGLKPFFHEILAAYHHWMRPFYDLAAALPVHFGPVMTDWWAVSFTFGFISFRTLFEYNRKGGDAGWQWYARWIATIAFFALIGLGLIIPFLYYREISRMKAGFDKLKLDTLTNSPLDDAIDGLLQMWLNNRRGYLYLWVFMFIAVAVDVVAFFVSNAA